MRGKDFWGPVEWGIIHILAAILRPGNEEYFIRFMWTLTHLLPCDYCKGNLEKKLRSIDARKYEGSNSMFWYTYIIHDMANRHISKQYPDKPPKISPPFDDVLIYYSNPDPTFWGPIVWASIHILAVTLRRENAEYFREFLGMLVHLLPTEDTSRKLGKFLNEYPVEPYLRNNHDAFFYTYMLHDNINKQLGKTSPPFQDVKSFYFSSMGEECSDCKV